MPAFQSFDLNSTGLSDQTPTVFQQCAEYKVVFILIFLVVLLIVSSISKGTIIYYICIYAPPRPINRMMLIDQICQLFTSSIIGSMTIVSLIRRTPTYCRGHMCHQLLVVLGGHHHPQLKCHSRRFRHGCLSFTLHQVYLHDCGASLESIEEDLIV